MNKNYINNKWKNKYDDKFKRITIRFTKDKEWESILKFSEINGTDVTSYIRSSALKGKTFTQKLPEPNVQLIYEINKIGVNFNQIAKRYNEDHLIKDEIILQFKVFHKLLISTIAKFT